MDVTSLIRLLSQTIYEDAPEFIVIRRSGRHVAVYNLQFAGSWHTAGEYCIKPMRAITAWLEDMGCSDINFRFTSYLQLDDQSE